MAVRGHRSSQLARSPERAPDLPRAMPVRGAYGDREAVLRGLDSARTIFMVSPPKIAERVGQHKELVDAAARMGVGHLVYTSFFGAPPDVAFTLARDHVHTKAHIRVSAMGCTFLRDNLYTEPIPDLVGDDGDVRGPAGTRRAAFATQDDVADAATVLRRTSNHAAAVYELTGPKSFTLEEAAAVPYEVLERAITRRRKQWSRPAPRAPPTTPRSDKYLYGHPFRPTP
ncbi:NmrA family NAD(P)-binding protein [Streptomyces sp. NPDC057623]|uniref:NmrA family NAD(P)-binding protein n=1 Tax=Streptomyces sp. NPDC057623 TaxID=3346187 RepID=UPI0036BC891F